ncbi:MAG: ATP-grasp domain-containing protein [Fibrobacter sp.]|nr:ATP-grasp domain-containing protein [Fibrobacter sp.]
MKKRLLLLGGGHAEIPLIQAAQELGYFVITTGNAREGLGHPYADKNVFADFSDKDAMLELARAEGVSAVCSGCNDFALLSTVYVCEKLGLPGHDSFETSLQIHHKDKYRALAESLQIPTPRARIVRSLDEFKSVIEGGLQFPLIVKPVDLTGGKGIHRVNNVSEALIAYEDAVSRTREDHVVVEEFVIGTNHGFSAFLIGGKVVFYFADNEQYFLNKYMVSGANTPSTTSEHGLQLLVEYSERIAERLKLVDGILHIQYIEKADGTPVIIEICRRPPGDLYIKFVKYATGVNYPKMIISAECGMDSSTLLGMAQAQPLSNFLRHCVMTDRTGVVAGVDFAPEIQKNVVEKFLWFKEGEQVTDPLYYKAGIVFMQFDSVEVMTEKTAKMSEYIKVRFK